jgi:hypothetical protein
MEAIDLKLIIFNHDQPTAKLFDRQFSRFFTGTPSIFNDWHEALSFVKKCLNDGIRLAIVVESNSKSETENGYEFSKAVRKYESESKMLRSLIIVTSGDEKYVSKRATEAGATIALGIPTTIEKIGKILEECIL